MSDFKSKLPDFKELSSMASKLFKGLKTSVDEIIQDYKEKRAHEENKESTEVAGSEEKASKATHKKSKEDN